MEIREKIKAIICDKLSVSPEEVTPEKTMFDLGADSLDSVELIMEVESQLNVHIPDVDFEKMTTVNDIYEYVENYKAKKEN